MLDVTERPDCPECGVAMHRKGKQTAGGHRFRCYLCNFNMTLGGKPKGREKGCKGGPGRKKKAVSDVLPGIPSDAPDIRPDSGRGSDEGNGAGWSYAGMDEAGANDLKTIGRWKTWAECWRKVNGERDSGGLIRQWQIADEIDQRMRAWR